jgi:hypothetical protein
MWLLCYGANNPSRLKEHLGRSVETARAYVDDYERVFRGQSTRWGGGVASLEPKAGARTFGLVADVTRADLGVLDQVEGVPSSYTRTQVPAHVGADGGTALVWVYLANSQEFNPPSRRYIDQVARTVAAYWTMNGRPVRRSDIPVR